MGLGEVETQELIDELLGRFEAVLIVVSREGQEAPDDDYETASVHVTGDRWITGVGLATYACWQCQAFLEGVEEDEEVEDDDA